MATATAEKKEVSKAPAGQAGQASAANTAAPVKITMSPKVAEARQVVDHVAALANKYIASGELILPKDYAINNALKSAWLVLQDVKDKDKRPALEVCTKHSVANALLDMIVQGLNPMKKQAYFVVYGTTLICQRSYFGAQAIAERVNPAIKDWGHGVVYEGDVFKYGIRNGKKTVTEHEQDISSVNRANIIAAYSIALDKNGDPIRTEIMTFDEIKEAWAQSKVNPVLSSGELKEGSTHERFSADMAIKTVTNKNCKHIINSSSDNALLLDRVNRVMDAADADMVREEIDDQANTGPLIGMDEAKPGAEETVSETMIQCPSGGIAVTQAYCDNECMDRETCTAHGSEGTKADDPKPAPAGQEMKSRPRPF